MKLKVNFEIALTHILSRKKQTLIAALGVTMGMSMFIFSNSLMKGFNKYSKKEMFKVISHIRIYKEDEISSPLLKCKKDQLVLITNPKIITQSKSIVNPYDQINNLRAQSYVTYIAPRVNVDLFYNNGRSQLKGIGNGISVKEADKMFNIKSTMIAGNLEQISYDLNAIIIGKIVAKKMNVGLGDNLTISSSYGILKIMRVAGIFSTGNRSIDESRCYMHINSAQQLVKQNSTYITEILLNIKNPDESSVYVQKLAKLTNYKVEDWKTANADQLAGDKMRDIMTIVVPFTILLVAAFGIYNILNMTITQKLNDIAILKATGFSGKDVIKIFGIEAIAMGMVGILMGLGVGAILIKVLQNVYLGEPIGYFPIFYEPSVFITSSLASMLVTIGAGYLPARKAAKVDPVSIFRSL